MFAGASVIAGADEPDPQVSQVESHFTRFQDGVGACNPFIAAYSQLLEMKKKQSDIINYD